MAAAAAMPLQYITPDAWILHTLSSSQPLLCSTNDAAAVAATAAVDSAAARLSCSASGCLLLLFLGGVLNTIAGSTAAAAAAAQAFQGMHQVEHQSQVVPCVIVIAPHKVRTSLKIKKCRSSSSCTVASYCQDAGANRRKTAGAAAACWSVCKDSSHSTQLQTNSAAQLTLFAAVCLAEVAASSVHDAPNLLQGNFTAYLAANTKLVATAAVNFRSQCDCY
jgi:hypothetical protein